MTHPREGCDVNDRAAQPSPGTERAPRLRRWGGTPARGAAFPLRTIAASAPAAGRGQEGLILPGVRRVSAHGSGGGAAGRAGAAAPHTRGRPVSRGGAGYAGES